MKMEEQNETEVEEQTYSDGGTTDVRRVVERGTESEWLVSESVDQFVPPAMALVSVFLSWAVASTTIMDISRSMTGIDGWTGQLVLIISIGVIVVTMWWEYFAGVMRYVGGSLITTIALYQFYWNGQRKEVWLEGQTFDTEMAQMAASSLSIDAGIGLWLALIAGVVMVFVEYNHRRSV